MILIELVSYGCQNQGLYGDLGCISEFISSLIFIAMSIGSEWLANYI